MKESPSHAIIDGTRVSDDELMRRELARARAALSLLRRKLGADRMKELLKDEIAAVEASKQQWVAKSHEWTGSITEVRVRGGTAAGFLQWFHGRLVANDTEALLGGHPEHYAIVSGVDGATAVLETFGEWNVPGLVQIRFTKDEKEAVDRLDPELPIRMIGSSQSSDGKTCVRVLHQFGDTSEGFRARLGIYWPSTAPEALIQGHRWHLAVEFCNWTRMFVSGL